MNKNLIFSITVLCSLSNLHAFFDFEAFDDHFEQMEKQMKKMRKGMKKSMRALQSNSENNTAVSLKEDDDAVVITFSHIKNSEATLHGDHLSIVTPDQKIVVTVRGNVIGIETWTEQKDTRKQNENDDTFTAQYIGSSYSSMSQTVGSKLLLDEQSTGYDEENQELIIRIPKEVAKKGMPVTINKISKEKTDTGQEEANETE